MIKEVKKIEFVTIIEVIIEHPYKKSGDVSMFVTKNHHEESFSFSIPFHDWLYVKEAEKEITLTYAPSGYNHPINKTRLIAAMEYAMNIIESECFLLSTSCLSAGSTNLNSLE